MIVQKAFLGGVKTSQFYKSERMRTACVLYTTTTPTRLLIEDHHKLERLWYCLRHHDWMMMSWGLQGPRRLEEEVAIHVALHVL